MRGWERRIRSIERCVHDRLGPGCRVGQDCPGPRFSLQLEWDGPGTVVDDPCPLCGRRFADLSQSEARRFFWRLRFVFDDGTEWASHG